MESMMQEREREHARRNLHPRKRPPERRRQHPISLAILAALGVLR
jgi:hypothetical protein